MTMIGLSWFAVAIGFIVGAVALGHVTSVIAGLVVEREIRVTNLVMFVVLAGVAAISVWGFLRVFEGRWHWLTGAVTIWLILVILFNLTMIVVLDPGENNVFTYVVHFVVAAVLFGSAATVTVYLDEMYRSVESDNVVVDNDVRHHPLMVE